MSMMCMMAPLDHAGLVPPGFRRTGGVKRDAGQPFAVLFGNHGGDSVAVECAFPLRDGDGGDALPIKLVTARALCMKRSTPSSRTRLTDLATKLDVPGLAERAIKVARDAAKFAAPAEVDAARSAHVLAAGERDEMEAIRD